MIKNFIHTRFIQPAVDKAIMAQFTAETDSTFKLGTEYGKLFRDRYNYKRKDILEKSLRAWRINPIARRLVEITTSFVVGKGVEVEIKNKKAMDTIQAFWHHKLNRIDEQIPAWTDELSRAGDLFLLFSNVGDKTFIRPVPAEMITKIETTKNDTLQETKYIYGIEANNFYPAYTPEKKQKVFMRHYDINKPLAALFGESDFTPILPWLSTYTEWLENRAKLNKYRTAFMFVLRGKFKSREERERRQAEVAANPPESGSVLITDESESWGVLSANLDAFDARVDGNSIKKMIATGWGVPMHWLAEPEGSTRTTAIAAGTPTFRKLSARQNVIKNLITDVLTIVLSQNGIKADGLIVRMDDITQKDNAATALAIARSQPPITNLFDREIIDSEEVIRLVYRLAGEEVPANIGAGLRKPLTKAEQGKVSTAATGEERAEEGSADAT